ncbi:bifunctional hydroxymethylpyrimidine kinase/phosphomethylpyrimidine kinase (plasmid) [Photobacterium sp. DA100]|uniref:bifunctional hydroxymethylpyrimidine kinase/phosphomethylpyrimidine kinase n=1 Tax=Photobacterium sp. DA100 TaxID=3027472 RepID=UPI00247B26E1|nr:bifunctional hydroxymethylpyrimidine kinase/phosphomethylpyrimidine kinase [Photobacterium sp. DA100]WEM45587.1 bifunctional hydroxymethylpyrimidine kinase/phosphomethylpyrimidine kinase [Photobacterium sp. DA100]
MPISSNTPITLTIAGSDSGGGAGIQADIKAISATGGYACSVITALTAQNTQGVSGILAIDPAFVEQQLDAVFTDLDIKAVKIGMLSDANIIRMVATKLRQYQPRFLVIDPVMVATSGDLLLEQDAISTLKSELLPLADVITPNLPEAAALIGADLPQNEHQMADMISALRAIGSRSILLKGGHLENDASSTDLLILENDVVRMSTPRIATRNTHGTGCTLSAATASFLAQGYPLEQAVRHAKAYITKAIENADALQIGAGHGPVNHFFAGHFKPE